MPGRKLEIFILAGGLSTRMGRDKARVRVGRRSMLRHVRDAASQLRVPVRVIRRDAIARCGPLGGIFTALKRTRAETIFLLACDMPFISPQLLRAMLRQFDRKTTALFAQEDARAGFPILLRCEAAESIVSAQIAAKEFSLQSLAKKIRAKTFLPPPALVRQLINLNTPEDLQRNSIPSATTK